MGAGSRDVGKDTTKNTFLEKKKAEEAKAAAEEAARKEKERKEKERKLAADAFTYERIGINTVRVTGIKNEEIENIVIPDEDPQGRTVIEIDSEAFKDCSTLKSVTIPDSVTSIGEDAFWACSALTSITIGNGVTSIGNAAFVSCSSLESITVAAGNPVYHSAGNCLIETATGTLIAGCKYSIIPTDGSVTSIGYSAFENCSALKSIKIPSGVITIGETAFDRCSALTSITIPDSVTSIGKGAFFNCSALTSITIPDSVTSIGIWAFYSCWSLGSVTFKNPNGWYRTEKEDASIGTSETLTNPDINAIKLRLDFNDHYWYRK